MAPSACGWRRALAAVQMLVLAQGLAFAPAAAAAQAQAPVPPAPAIAAADAPRFAGLGQWPVGVTSLALVNPAQPDLALFAATAGKQGQSDRTLPVTLWYPARAGGATATAVFSARLPGKEGAAFDTASVAVQDAPADAGKRFPLVLLSHGFGGWGTFMSYLAESLASRGYVVAAIDHRDQRFTDAAGFGLSFGAVMLHRSADQRFVLRSLLEKAALPGDPLGRAIDPASAAIVGYSMGGFGALASAGAAYDGDGAALKTLPAPFKAALADAPPPPALKALVLLAPWGAQPEQRAWRAASLARIVAPVLLIAGDQDDIVDFRHGVTWLFDQLTGSRRHLLVYQNARHNIGGNPAPAAAADFASREYFEEPVWRKDRLMALNQHFIAAFLDRHLKGDTTMDAYLDLRPVRANEALWPLPFGQSAGNAFAAGSGASAGYWPGFQRRWAVGIEMHTRERGQ